MTVWVHSVGASPISIFPFLLANGHLILLGSMYRAKISTESSVARRSHETQFWPMRCREIFLGGASKQSMVLLIEKVHSQLTEAGGHFPILFGTQIWIQCLEW